MVLPMGFQGFSMGFYMGFQPLEERPDYGYLRQLLRDAFAKEGDLPWFLVSASGIYLETNDVS